MLIEQITQALTAVRQQKPLVVNITNLRGDEQHGKRAIGYRRFSNHGALQAGNGRDDVVRWRIGYQHWNPRQRLDTAYELCRRTSQCQW